MDLSTGWLGSVIRINLVFEELQKCQPQELQSIQRLSVFLRILRPRAEAYIHRKSLLKLPPHCSNQKCLRLTGYVRLIAPMSFTGSPSIRKVGRDPAAPGASLRNSAVAQYWEHIEESNPVQMTRAFQGPTVPQGVSEVWTTMLAMGREQLMAAANLMSA